jgi:hypothetical protein
MRATAADRPRPLEKNNALALCLLAWAVPGAGHLYLGWTGKGLVFLLVLPLLFVLGLAFDGRIFPFDFSQPLVALAAVADVGIGVPYFVVWVLGLGQGAVVSPSYEHGNTFLIVAGLLNALVVLDAYDIAVGRK